MPVSTTMAYDFGLRMLGLAYSYAGNYQVDSSHKPGTRVLMAPLAINMKHSDEALRLTTQAASGNPVGGLKA